MGRCRNGGAGVTISENAHVARDVTDWTVSLDELQSLCPALEWVSLIVPWFGDDLRAGCCTVRPMVDNAEKVTSGATPPMVLPTSWTGARVKVFALYEKRLPTCSSVPSMCARPAGS